MYNDILGSIFGLLLILSLICVSSQDSLAQNMPRQNLLPDVTSNISLIMTPDYPNNLIKDDLTDPNDKILTSTNETIKENSADDPKTGLDNQSQISNPISMINSTSPSNLTTTLQNNQFNKNSDSISPIETTSIINSTSDSDNPSIATTKLDNLPNLTNQTNSNFSKIIWENFTSDGGYSLTYPQNWNLTAYGNETHIISDKVNSDYFPLTSIFIQKVDPIALNNTQALAQVLPIDNISNDVIDAILNNSKLQSNGLLKYFMDLDYNVLEPTQIGKYIIDKKQASSFKVYKADDNYEREFIIVNNDGKIYNVEINDGYLSSFNEDAIETEDLKQQIIDSIQWINETSQNSDVQEIKEQEIVNNNGSDSSNEIKSKILSSEADLNITSSTYFFDDGNFKIVGEVLNNGSGNRELVKVVVTLYDGNNNVIGTELSYTNPSDLFSKQTAPFEIIIGQGDVSNTSAIKSFKLYLTSDVKASSSSSNTNEQLSRQDTAVTSDLFNSDLQSSSVSNTTSQNPLQKLMNLFKGTNSTSYSDDTQ